MPQSPPKLSFQKPKAPQAAPRSDRVGKRLLQCHLPEELSTEMRADTYIDFPRVRESLMPWP